MWGASSWSGCIQHQSWRPGSHTSSQTQTHPTCAATGFAHRQAKTAWAAAGPAASTQHASQAVKGCVKAAVSLATAAAPTTAQITTLLATAAAVAVLMAPLQALVLVRLAQTAAVLAAAGEARGTRHMSQSGSAAYRVALQRHGGLLLLLRRPRCCRLWLSRRSHQRSAAWAHSWRSKVGVHSMSECMCVIKTRPCLLCSCACKLSKVWPAEDTQLQQQHTPLKHCT